MWLATTIGFYSVTEAPGSSRCLQIRTRNKKDLENLCSTMRRRCHKRHRALFQTEMIVNTPNADYPYRLIVPRTVWSTIAVALAMTVRYKNFKSEVDRHPDQRSKLDAYHIFWSRLQDQQTARSLYHQTHLRQTQAELYGIGAGRTPEEDMVDIFTHSDELPGWAMVAEPHTHKEEEPQ